MSDKAATLGVAMGGRGAGFAHEVASIVLPDDGSGSFVATVRSARRIHDNPRQAKIFIPEKPVPISGLALMPLLFGMPILFDPVHIAPMEKVIDPASSLAFEAETEEADTLTGASKEPPVSAPAILMSVVQGALLPEVLATIFAAVWGGGPGVDQVRGLTFAALIFGIVAPIMVNPSRSSSTLKAMLWPGRALANVLPISGGLLAQTLFWQRLRDLLGLFVLPLRLLACAPLRRVLGYWCCCRQSGRSVAGHLGGRPRASRPPWQPDRGDNLHQCEGRAAGAGSRICIDPPRVQRHGQQEDSAMKGYVADIEDLTENNTAFRQVLYTGHHLQLVLMALQPGEDIGLETHATHDQFFRIEKGRGELEIDGVTHRIKGGDGIVVPAGARHNLTNIGDKPLRLCTIYGPPHHIDRLAQSTKSEALASTEVFDGAATEVLPRIRGAVAVRPAHGPERGTGHATVAG